MTQATGIISIVIETGSDANDGSNAKAFGKKLRGGVYRLIMPEPTDAKVNEEIVFLEIDAHIGAIATEFNNLEAAMRRVLVMVLVSDHDGSMAVWSALMWGARLKLVGSLINGRPLDDRIKAFWKRLAPFLGEVGSDRNYVVHGERMVHHPRDGERTESMIWGGFPDYTYSKRPEEMSLGELKEIILDIRAANAATDLLNNALQEHMFLPRLATTSIRRRKARQDR